MNKLEFAQKLMVADMTRKEAEAMVDLFEATILEGLKEDGEVTFLGSKFKTVAVAPKESKIGRNPSTGEAINIPAKPASTKLVFKIGKKTKEFVASL